MLDTIKGSQGDLARREMPEQAEAPVGSVSRDNRELNDAGAQNQALTPEQIAELRSSGQGGQAIAAALASHSATYAAKTEFSQEKYLRKKSRKYCIQATLVQPTARSICEASLLPPSFSSMTPFIKLLCMASVRQVPLHRASRP